ncbi:MAG: hypothetical protein HQL09_02350 [Nitrospirae bacterium]|nr:hypothetical protein [Nitrospirota bacterium]
MGSVWMIIAFATVLLVIIWYTSTVNTKYYKAKQELTRKVNLFSRDHFISFDGTGALAIDKKTRKILFVEQEGRKQKVVSFEDILSVELIEDATTITKTSAAGVRKLGRETIDTLVTGASAAGGYPAGDSQTKGADLVRCIVLRIVIADVQDPYRLIFFWNDRGRGISRTSEQYGQASGKADHWCAMLQVIIKQVDEEEARPRQSEWRASMVG